MIVKMTWAVTDLVAIVITVKELIVEWWDICRGEKKYNVNTHESLQPARSTNN